MKRLLFLSIILTGFLFSCSSDDNGGETATDPDPDPDPVPQIAYVDKIVSTSSSGSTELRFVYDDDNKLVRNETDEYFRQFTYEGNNITKIESVTLPNTPYYTIEFDYDSSSRVMEVRRTNHHNGTIFFITYEYNTGGNIGKVCVYSNMDDYNAAICDRYYDFAYVGGTTNYAEKTLYQINGGFPDVLEASTWTYDTNESPYFGEAISRIQLPYATDGTGMDWEYLYNDNNPLSKYIFDFISNESKLRRDFQYQYNEEGKPTERIITSYDIFTGEVTSVFTQNFSYVLR
ncbi:hypothetical protein POV27_02455 [Aureisphaera galaxeae]|uniref:hypothetical protein n=1 Tax=Aureisphaera galaxeae TaxID=1538023 RepID=UPI002350F2C8|nr:hypothetical protein [Aureisphaera galaxeae]MDC8002903.1 hypothetical protein [Aureisphaera galaxeae]